MSPIAPAQPRLAFSVVESAVPAERRNLYMLHGIFGRARNWAAIARPVTDQRADWRAVLADLRCHGDSPMFAPPHTIATAAVDVTDLAVHSRLAIDAILGHSFGGKVALQIASMRPSGLRQVWMIDSTPDARAPHGSAWQMLGVVRTLKGPFTSRQDAATAIVAAGFPLPVAAWMTSNLVWRDAQYRWRLDFEAMGELLLDFFRVDLWSLIEDPPPGLTVHVVKATESSVLDESACTRIENAGWAHGRVRLHRVRGGHWIHTDNPSAIVSLLARELPRPLPTAP